MLNHRYFLNLILDGHGPHLPPKLMAPHTDGPTHQLAHAACLRCAFHEEIRPHLPVTLQAPPYIDFLACGHLGLPLSHPFLSSSSCHRSRTREEPGARRAKEEKRRSPSPARAQDSRRRDLGNHHSTDLSPPPVDPPRARCGTSSDPIGG